MVALAYLVCVSLAALAVLTFGLAALFCAVSDKNDGGTTRHLGKHKESLPFYRDKHKKQHSLPL